MKLTIQTVPVRKGRILPLVKAPIPDTVAHVCGSQADLFSMPSGATLNLDGKKIFKIIGSTWLYDEPVCQYAPLLLALEDASESSHEYTLSREGWSLGVITLSDKGSLGLRKDEAGPIIPLMLKEALPIASVSSFMIPDDASILKALLLKLALADHCDLVCSTGGTGVSPRDITPQAAASLFDAILPGFAQAMMNKSLEITPNACISRAQAGIIGNTLVINLPGSPKAVRENLAAVLPALGHALAKIHGDSADCGA